MKKLAVLAGIVIVISIILHFSFKMPWSSWLTATTGIAIAVIVLAVFSSRGRNGPRSVVPEWEQQIIWRSMVFRRLLAAITAMFVVWLVLGSNFATASTFSWIVALALAIPCGILLNPGCWWTIPAGQVGRVKFLWPVNGRAEIMATKPGESGWKARMRLPGTFTYINPLWNDVGTHHYTDPVAHGDKVVYAVSRIGNKLPPERKVARAVPAQYYEDATKFLAADGFRGRQGTLIPTDFPRPIDLIAFAIDDGTGPYADADETKYKKFTLGEGKLAMVECLDSFDQLPIGWLWARLGGFDDIEELITEELAKKTEAEAESKTVRPAGEAGNDPFIYGKDFEMQLGKKCLEELMEGPPLVVDDYQNVLEFENLKGTAGKHWRLIRGGKTLNLNRFKFKPKEVDPLVVESGTVGVMISQTGIMNTDITHKWFDAGEIVRVSYAGINVAPLSPTAYPFPPGGYKVEIGHTEQLALYFGTTVSEHGLDTGLNSITVPSKDNVSVSYDLNVLLTVPAESWSVIIAAYGNEKNFFRHIIGTMLTGYTIEFIRNHNIAEIVGSPALVIDEILPKFQEALRTLYGVMTHGIKVEAFVTDKDYSDEQKALVLNQAKLLTTEKGILFQTRNIIEQGLEGESEGKREAGRQVQRIEMLKEEFGPKAGFFAFLMETVTDGKHPYISSTVGLALSDNGSEVAKGAMPIGAMLAGLLKDIQSDPTSIPPAKAATSAPAETPAAS